MPATDSRVRTTGFVVSNLSMSLVRLQALADKETGTRRADLRKLCVELSDVRDRLERLG